MEQVNAEEYWRLGGKLNRDSFEKARGVLSEQANKEKCRVSDNSLAQAENMERFSQVPITPEQKYLYAVLREMSGKTEEGPTPPGTMPLRTLDDQLLLAEVFLLMGDMANRNSFMDAYPDIFKKEKVVEPRRI